MSIKSRSWISFFALTLMFSYADLASAKGRKNSEQRLQGIVQKCHDGDTCRVALAGPVPSKIAKVRFAGVDTPELKQPYGKEAQQFTENILRGKLVRLVCKGKSYDRITCEVFLDGRNINMEIVQNGWGYDLPKYSKGLYKEAESIARAKKIGIWKTANLTSPHCFRHKTDQRCRVANSFMP